MVNTEIACGVANCGFVARHESENVAICLMNNHNVTHTTGNNSTHAGAASSRAPKANRPEVKQDITDEEWNIFLVEWERYKKCYTFAAGQLQEQLFQCCERALGTLLLRIEPDICTKNETDMLSSIKNMAVLHLAVTVRRTSLMTMKQARGQTCREFFALVRSAGAACEFRVKCPHACCEDETKTAKTDYTPCMVKDVFICGLDDAEIVSTVMV